VTVEQCSWSRRSEPECLSIRCVSSYSSSTTKTLDLPQLLNTLDNQRSTKSMYPYLITLRYLQVPASHHHRYVIPINIDPSSSPQTSHSQATSKKRPLKHLGFSTSPKPENSNSTVPPIPIYKFLYPSQITHSPQVPALL